MIAGGGTGGHVYPGIAIYRGLQRLHGRVDVLFVGVKNGVEAKIFDDLGLPHVLLSGRGLRRASFTAKITSPFVVGASIIRSIRQIVAFKPDVVIGTGGFASVAMVCAAFFCRKRRVLQEQNSVPGLSNRMLARFAHLILLSYEESRTFFGASAPCTVVGNPLRVKPPADREAAFRFFDLSPERETVLIFGGSRGAHSINAAAIDAIKSITTGHDVQFVVLAGESDYKNVSAALAESKDRVRIYPFLEHVEHAYGVADVAVARAGASAVFELAAFGIPTVFVPYPYAADDHQRKNVKELEEKRGVVVIDNTELNSEGLEAIIVSLLADRERRVAMSKTLRDWSVTDADDVAAKKINELVRASRKLAVRRRRIKVTV